MPPHLPLREARALQSISYPATREDLIAHVTAHGAQPQVLATLRLLPEKSYASEADLATELRYST